MVWYAKRMLSGVLVALVVMMVLPATGFAAGQTYWAVVNSDGSLARGTPGVQSARTADGIYYVHFAKSISHCARIASAGSSGGVRTLPPVFVNLAVDSTDPKAVYVAVMDNTNVGVNTAGFHLQVWCNPKDLWVTTRPKGSVVNHGGASASVERVAQGRFQVLFGRPVNKCGYQASVSSSNFTVFGSVLPEVNSVAGNHRKVLVTLRTAAGDYSDVPFHIIVTCGQTRIWAVLPSPVTSGIPRGGHLLQAGTVMTGITSAQFDVPINQCSWVATVGRFNTSVAPQGLISTTLIADSVVGVETDDVFGNPVDRGAHLSVVC